MSPARYRLRYPAEAPPNLDGARGFWSGSVDGLGLVEAGPDEAVLGLKQFAEPGGELGAVREGVDDFGGEVATRLGDVAHVVAAEVVGVEKAEEVCGGRVSPVALDHRSTVR